MTLGPKTNQIETTWFGPQLPRLHALCIASWIEAGYEANVYSYRDSIEGLPSGATIINGEKIVSSDKMFFLKNQSNYAHFSDIFRIELMQRGLGTWCDADYMMLRPFPQVENVMIGRERNDWPCNAVMWIRPGHPISNGILRNFDKNGLAEWTYIKPRWHAFLAKLQGKPYTLEDLPNGHWGRHALDYFIRKLKLDDAILPQKTFYAEETYTGALFEKQPFEHLTEDEGVKGFHFFNKSHDHDNPTPGSFFAWATEKFSSRIA